MTIFTFCYTLNGENLEVRIASRTKEGAIKIFKEDYIFDSFFIKGF